MVAGHMSIQIVFVGATVRNIFRGAAAGRSLIAYRTNSMPEATTTPSVGECASSILLHLLSCKQGALRGPDPIMIYLLCIPFLRYSHTACRPVRVHILSDTAPC